MIVHINNNNNLASLLRQNVCTVCPTRMLLSSTNSNCFV